MNYFINCFNFMWNSCVCVFTDITGAITDVNAGVMKAGRIKHIPFSHCMIHWEALVTKMSPELAVLYESIKRIKNHALNSHLF